MYPMLLTVSFLACIGCVTCKELRAVVVLYRHGDRTPMSSWPNDKYFHQTSLWPDGYGQLTNMGKQRHYKLGQWFRRRYNDFLSSTYNYKDIFVRSTDVDRTIMSAASNLAGLYPPAGSQYFYENITWMPIPIHTRPEKDDPILTSEVPCPKYDRLHEQLLNSLDYQDLNEKYAELYKHISQVTGFPVENVGLGTFSMLYQTISIYKGLNLTLPHWTEKYWPQIQGIAGIFPQLSTYTQGMARLRTGPFFHYLLDYLYSIKNQTQDSTKPPKFLMLSGHDNTISDRMNAMGVYTYVAPEVAATVIWELKSRNTENDDWYLNLYFRNSTNFVPLTIPGCNFDCLLSDFADILKPVTANVEQWTQECYEK